MSKEDRLIWEDVKDLSGHSLIILAPLVNDGKDAWPKTTKENTAWVAVGVRDGSGLIDVAVIEGKSTDIGVFTPNEGSAMSRDIALSFGRAVNSEMPDKPGFMERLGRKVGTHHPAEDYGITISPVFNEKMRKNILADIPEKRSLIFGEVARKNENIAKFIESFKGDFNFIDIQKPGVVAAINTANGAKIGDGSKLEQNKIAASVWQAIHKDTPGVFDALETIAQKGRTSTIAAPQSVTSVYERTAEALAGSYITGQSRDNAATWVEAIGRQDVSQKARRTLYSVIPELSKRGLEDSKPWISTNATGESMNELASAVRLTKSMDVGHPTSRFTHDMLANMPARLIKPIGSQMANVEAEIGRDPMTITRKMVLNYIVKPATASLSKKKPVLVENLMVQHAQSGISEGVALSQMPQSIVMAYRALKAHRAGDPAAKNLLNESLFKNKGDQKEPLEQRAAEPTTRKSQIKEKVK